MKALTQDHPFVKGLLDKLDGAVAVQVFKFDAPVRLVVRVLFDRRDTLEADVRPQEGEWEGTKDYLRNMGRGVAVSLNGERKKRL